MPNPGLEEPIRKVTLNLWDADIRFLKKKYPESYTVIIREWVRRGVRAAKAQEEGKADAK